MRGRRPPTRLPMGALSPGAGGGMALRWTLVALAIAVVAVGVAALTEGEPLSEVVATRGSLVLVPVLIATTSLLVIVTCRTAVDAHAEGFRPATLLWIAVVLGCLALVWPAVLLVLCWSVVLSGLDTIILLPPASEISGAIAGILHPARLLAAGGGLTVLALATSAPALDVRWRSGRRAGAGVPIRVRRGRQRPATAHPVSARPS